MKKKFYPNGGVADFQSKFAQARKSGASSFEDGGRKYTTEVEKTDATDNVAVSKLQELMLANKHYSGKVTGMANSDTMVAYAKAKDAGMEVPEEVEKSLPMFMQLFHKQKQKEKAAASSTTTSVTPAVTPATNAGSELPKVTPMSVVKEGGIEQGAQGPNADNPITRMAAQKYAAPATQIPKTIGKKAQQESKPMLSTKQVIQIQNQLKAMELYKDPEDKVDGKFGPKTLKALDAFFAADKGSIKVNGISDVMTLKKMTQNTIEASKMYNKKGVKYAPSTLKESLDTNGKALVKKSKDAVKTNSVAPIAPMPQTIGKKAEPKIISPPTAIDKKAIQKELPPIYANTTFDEFYQETEHGKKGIRYEHSRINYRKIYDEIRAGKRSAVRVEQGQRSAGRVDPGQYKFYTINYNTDYRSTVEDKKYGDEGVGTGNPLGGWKKQAITPKK